MAYKVQIGFAPGDWDIHSIHADRSEAENVAASLRGTIHIPRYRFALPIRVVKFNDRCSPRREITVAKVSPPVLRKRS